MKMLRTVLIVSCLFLSVYLSAQEKFSYGIQIGGNKNKLIAKVNKEIPKGAVAETLGFGRKGMYANAFLAYKTCKWQSFQFESGYVFKKLDYDETVFIHQWSNAFLSNFHITSFLSLYGGLDIGVRKFVLTDPIDDFYVRLGLKEKGFITSAIGGRLEIFKFAFDFRYYFPYKRHNEYYRTANIQDDTPLFTESIQSIHLGIIYFLKK